MTVYWSSAHLLISFSLWELVTSFEIVGHQWVGLGYFFGHSYHMASFEYMADLRLTQKLSIDQFNNGGLYKYSWPLWLCMIVDNMILNRKWFPIQISQSTFNKLLSFLFHKNYFNKTAVIRFTPIWIYFYVKLCDLE